MRQIRSLWLGLSLGVLFIGSSLAAAAGPEPGEPLLHSGEPLRAVAVDGGRIALGGQSNARALALVWLGVECPIARKFLPELKRIAAEHSGQPIEFYGVISDPTVTRRRAAEFVREFEIDFPVLFDASLALAERFRPTHTPEAFVVAADGRLLYRGRIDDRFRELGAAQGEIAAHDLSDAIRAALDGRAPTAPRTAPVGCRFEALDRPPSAAPAVTFHRDIAPILWTTCVDCHRAGEVAPFALTSYADAAKRAAQIAEVVESRFMPPWKAEPGHGQLIGERRLSAREREWIAGWAAAGAPEGNADDAPPLPEFKTGWRLGEPDLVLEMPEEFEIPADGGNVFRWFALPVDLPEDRVVAAYEFQAGNPKIVHHANMYLDNTGGARRLDAKDPGPGYGHFGGPGFMPSNFLGTWAPGVAARALPPGMGIPLRKGTVIGLQMHYTPSGRPERDRTRIGLHFADPADARNTVTTIPVVNHDIDIPAGVADHRVGAEFTVPVACTVFQLIPHMHYLGQEMKITAHPPEAEPIVLLWIKGWDFNWQDHYQLAQPVALPKGTRLMVEAVYDNTAANPRNPHSPPQTVRYGPQSTDEMCLAGVQVALERPEDFSVIAAALMQHFIRSRAGKPWIDPFN